MTQFGPCEWCETDAIVVINERRACIKHVDDAMNATVGSLRRVLAEVADSDSDS